jgi:hypothetical protein
MYATISDFGSQMNEPYNDPTLYCVLDGLDSQFMYGSTGFQKGNYLCSEFMTNRCAVDWDDVCQAVFENPAHKYPRPQCCPAGLTDGQAMLRETAFKKYLLATKNCWFACEPFDPTVANSPLVCYDQDTAPTTGPSAATVWSLDGKPMSRGPALDNPPCEKLYGFTDKQMRELDSDPIMHNLLKFPNIALDLLTKLAIWVRHAGLERRLGHTQFMQFVRNNKLI